MDVRTSVKPNFEKGDKIVKRGGRVYRINSTDPNRKQRQRGPKNRSKKRCPIQRRTAGV